MIGPRVTLLVLAAAAAMPQGLGAQVATRLEAGALTVGSGAAEVPASVLRVSPEASYTLPFLNLSASGSAWLHENAWYVTDGSLRAALHSPIVYGVRAELLGNASRALDVRSMVDDLIDAQARIHFLFKERAGAWIGAGTARPWRVAVVSSIDVVNGGAWVANGSSSYSSTVTRYSFTKESSRRFEGGVPMCGSRPHDPSRRDLIFAVGNCREQTQVTDVEAGAKWTFLGVEYAAQAGHRFGPRADVSPESRRWASSTVTKWITPQMAFAVGGGRKPANPGRGIPAQTYGMIGMVFAYLPDNGAIPVAPPRAANVQMFDIRSVAGGTQVITVRVGSVARVDVMGDFSNWEPIALTRRPGTDVWELRMRIEPGVHHINLRVDGGLWAVPPGLPVIPDGFGNEVGLLVVNR